MIVTGENRKTRKKNLCQRHIFYNKSHMKWPWIVPWRPPWQAREISINTVDLCNENQTQVLYTTHQAWWLLNHDRDPKILYIKQCVQLCTSVKPCAQSFNGTNITITHDATYFTGTNSTYLVAERTPDFCMRIKRTSRIAVYCIAHRFIN